MHLTILSRVPLLLAALGGPLLGAPADPAISPADLQADFRELYARLRESHADLYARRDKAAYDRLFAQMLADFNRPLPRAKALEAFQRFMAFGRIAHARMEEPDAAFETYRVNGGRAFPLRLRIANGRTYVAANLSGTPGITPGDEILTLEGRPMGEVLAAFSRFTSADTDYLLQVLAENDSGRLLWKHLGPRASFRVVQKKADGKRQARVIPARTRTEMTEAAKTLPKGLEKDWTARIAKLLPGGVAYLHPGPFFNPTENEAELWNTNEFHAFLDEAFRRFDKEGATRLLIDLRDNPGGDNSFSDHLVAWFATKPFCFTAEFRVKVSAATTASNATRLPHSLAGSVSHRYAEAFAKRKPGETFCFEMPIIQPRAGERYQGQVFLLVNRHSYSNTVNVAAMVQDYGFGKVLGEETADLATTYGAMEHFKLTHTGFKVGYPKAHILRPNKNMDARGVVPDIAIPTPVIESAEDPVLQKALEIVKR